MVSCPLLTPPDTPFRRDSLRSRGETGETGLGSVRRADFWKPYCPEFTLRKPPRITVRGHSVQGGSVLLRKASLPSSVDPWSTKRPCGPLAFRRATEGSRVPRKGWGVKRGRETLVSLPLLPSAVGTAYPCRWAPTLPAAGRRQCTRHVMANTPRPGRACLACGGRPPERRKVYPQQRVKKDSPAAASRRNGGRSISCFR